MGFGYSFRDGDWPRLRQIIQKLSSLKVGPESTPTFAGLTITRDLAVGGDVTVAGGLAVDTDTLVVDADNHRVGIGETAPETLLEMTSTAPYLTLHNSTEENINDGRESRIDFKGEQGAPSAGTESTLARIEVGHDGTGDDQKGYLDILINDGNDGDSPSHAITVTSTGRFGVGTKGPNAPCEVKGFLPGEIGGYQSGLLHVTTADNSPTANSVITGHNSYGGNRQLWYLGSTTGSNNNIAFINRQDGSMSFRTRDTERFKIEADGDIVMSHDLAVSGTGTFDILTVTSPSAQDWELGPTNFHGGALAMTPSDNAQASRILQTGGAGTGVNVFHEIMGKGTADQDFGVDTDYEWLQIGWQTAGRYIIRVVSGPGGSQRDLVLSGDASFTQLVLEAGGDITMENVLTVSGDITGESGLIIDGDITQETSTSTLTGGAYKDTSIGGRAVKLTNETGNNTVIGQLVIASPDVDDAFETAGANSDNVIGVVLNAGIADGEKAWIVHSGRARVLMDAGGSVHGDRIISSVIAGSADVWNTGGAVATHFQEIGHCVQSRTGAGLARCILHFN